MTVMKRVMCVAVMAAIGIFLVSPSTASADFLNPGFETVDATNASRPADWSAFAGTGDTVERNTDDPRTGGFDLMMQSRSDVAGFAGAYQFFVVSPGDQIEFSAWGKVDEFADGTAGIDNEGDPSTQMRMRFEWRNADGSGGTGLPNTQINLTNTINGTYQEFTVSDTVPAGAGGVRAVFALNRNDDKFYFDDASFTVVPEPASIGLALFAGLGLLSGRRRRS